MRITLSLDNRSLDIIDLYIKYSWIELDRKMSRSEAVRSIIQSSDLSDLLCDYFDKEVI